MEVDGDRLVAVMSLAVDVPAAACGVVIVVGGPQYRVGSHRQFVLLARALAAAGIPTLRFDYRGMGDSDGRPRSFEEIDDDIAAAITEICNRARVSHVVLWGLCDGATASLMYAHRDKRVAGIVAVNPWARTVKGQAKVQLRHYYADRFLQREFWRKLARGQLDLLSSAKSIRNAFLAAFRGTARPKTDLRDESDAGRSYLERMDDGWSTLGRPVLFVLSGRDYTAKEFLAWVAEEPARSRRLTDGSARVVELPDADHTFSSRSPARLGRRQDYRVDPRATRAVVMIRRTTFRR